MKEYLFLSLLLLAAVILKAQNPTVAELQPTGNSITWYDAATGGNVVLKTTILVDGTHYYASQTVNGVESTARLDVTAAIHPSPQGSLSANGPFCLTGAGTLTWTATTGTGPYSVVYYDGTANRSVTNVTSGTPFAVFTTPVTSGTTYTLVSVQDANCTRSGGFTGNTATISVNAIPSAPTAGSHTAALAQIIWNWNTTSGATGYKWNTTNDYGSATDMGTAVTQTEISLTCNTGYTRYVWAYNASGCASAVTTLTQTTPACTWTGGLTSYRVNINSEYDFIVTGTTTGSVWGCSNLYTDDSALQTTAVHAGYVNNGQTKTVRVRILVGQSSYSGCTQNGVTSSSYTSWEGSYQIISSW